MQSTGHRGGSSLRESGGSHATPFSKRCVIAIAVVCVTSILAVTFGILALIPTSSESSARQAVTTKEVCIETPKQASNRSMSGVIDRLSTTYTKSGKRYTSLEAALKETNEYNSATVGNKNYRGGTFPTDKKTRHFYLRHYATLFAPYVDRDITILEIGVKMGGSVALWREFFSPQSHVFGIDINPLVPVFTQEPNIKVLVMDSRDSTLVDQIFSLRKFDIIIDDGNHTEEAIFLTFKSLWQHTEPTGVYVLEDVDARPLRVIALMQSNGWEHCWIQDTVNAAHKMEYLVIGYPPLSLAPRIGECMVPYWNETSTL